MTPIDPFISSLEAVEASVDSVADHVDRINKKSLSVADLEEKLSGEKPRDNRRPTLSLSVRGFISFFD